MRYNPYCKLWPRFKPLIRFEGPYLFYGPHCIGFYSGPHTPREIINTLKCESCTEPATPAILELRRAFGGKTLGDLLAAESGVPARPESPVLPFTEPKLSLPFSELLA